MSDYKQWIAANVQGNGFGECAELTEKMGIAFPELRRVRGHYHDAFWGPRTHWWLVTPQGEIVDPTKAQFPDQGGEYVPWRDGEEEPTGRCMDCGSYAYNGDYFCSAACERSTVSYLNSGIL